MIGQFLRNRVEADGSRPFLVGSDWHLTYAQALEQASVGARSLAAFEPGTVFLRGADSPRLAAALFACDIADRRSCLVSPESPPEEVERIIENLGGGVLVSDGPFPHFTRAVTLNDMFAGQGGADPPPESGEAGMVILTTGTTGTPKGALYTWARLLDQARVFPGEQDSVWLLGHPLGHLAGLQTMMHTLRNGATLAVPRSRRFTDLISCIVEHQVDSMSATPTLWRSFAGRMDAETAAALPIRRITLGGEATTKGLLDRLQQFFPDASISQIFGTTELGACFSVKDGEPGFPAEYLERPVGNVALRIIDGQLHIRAESGMVGYAGPQDQPERNDDWVGTGDLVEQVDDRVLFRGRTTGIISVAGTQVFPLKVEELALSVPGVESAHAFGKPNPVTGQIVALDLEIEQGYSPDEVIGQIQSKARRHLTRYEQPRAIQVTTIETRNEKVVRRNTDGESSRR